MSGIQAIAERASIQEPSRLAKTFLRMNAPMHSAAHTDPLYRSFAETARKEAGDKIYAFCSGCHSPAGVASGLIPRKTDADLPAEAKAGVTCDVCHSISSVTSPSVL